MDSSFSREDPDEIDFSNDVVLATLLDDTRLEKEKNV